MKDAPLKLIMDIGSGYVKYGTPQQPVPLVLPAALKSTELNQGNPTYHELDPGRGPWVFPLEDGLLPPNPSLLIQLCNLIIEQIPDLNEQREKLELMLLLFPQSQPDQVTTLCQTLKDSLGCLHVDAAIQQILTWGYWGRKTGLIIDIGYTITFITPIYRGFLLEEQIFPITTGSFFVSAEIRKLLLHQVETDSTNYKILYSQLAEDGYSINKIKQTLCKVHPFEIKEAFSEKAFFTYRGVELSLGALPWQALEVLFQPTLLGVGDKGLTDAVIKILQDVDSTVRAELASNIILAGGGSMFPGLTMRLKNDLKRKMPHLAIKVYDLEYPMYSSWLGATKM